MYTRLTPDEEVPNPEQKIPPVSLDVTFSSPRQLYLEHIASTTLRQNESASVTRWQDFSQPLQLILQTFSTVSDQSEDFWFPTAPYFQRETFSAGTVLYHQGDSSTGFYLLEQGILRAHYELPQGQYSELIVAGTTCGELPFFSSTQRTSTTSAEGDCVTWMLDHERWRNLQDGHPRIAQELLTISLKLTSERMDAITK